MAAFAYLARALGPVGFGQLEFALAIVVFFTLLADSGLSAYGAREVAKDERSLASLTSHIALLRGILAIGAAGLLAVLATLLDTSAAVTQLLWLYSLTLLVAPGLFPWAFQGRDLMHIVAAATALRWTVFAVGVFLFVGGPEQLWAVPIIEAGALTAVVTLYVALLRRAVTPGTERIDLGFARSILHQAFPIGAAELVWAAKVYFATVVLGLVADGAQVGWFGAAHRIVLALHTFVWLYFFNLLPSLARSSQGQRSELHRLVGTSLQVSAWAGIFVGVAGSFLAEPLVTLMYGPRYQEAVGVFQLLIWLIPLALLSGNFRYTLIAYGRQRSELAAAAWGAALNLALCGVLGLLLGLRGAALAIVLSEIVILALAAAFVRRSVARVPLWPHLWRPLVAGGVLIAVLSAMPTVNVWITGGLALLMYGLTLAILQPGLVGDTHALFFRAD